MAKKHAIVGWVKNTTRGTVIGVAQGPAAPIQTMYVPLLYIHSQNIAGREVYIAPFTPGL